MTEPKCRSHTAFFKEEIEEKLECVVYLPTIQQKVVFDQGTTKTKF